MDELDDIVNFIGNGLTRFKDEVLLTAAAGIVIVMIIWSGFKYITGDAEAGKKSLTAAIIGLVIVLLSYLIFKTVIEFITAFNA